MKGRDKIKAWVELDKERDSGNICRICFMRTLQLILNKEHLEEIKK